MQLDRDKKIYSVKAKVEVLVIITITDQVNHANKEPLLTSRLQYIYIVVAYTRTQMKELQPEHNMEKTKLDHNLAFDSVLVKRPAGQVNTYPDL